MSKLDDIFQVYEYPESHPRFIYKRWGNEERQRLLDAVNKYLRDRNQKIDWNNISKHVKGRSSRQCMRQYQKLIEDNVEQQKPLVGQFSCKQEIQAEVHCHTRQNSAQLEDINDFEEMDFDFGFEDL
ncbi:Myb-like_DNA-binding domain-containing protein [Hexamita inflata]|uniref:Myb-like DNA-binding domain-containing protein n=1 Tax=Hexamita inflata TaxID=28002 RepID=A0AA86UFQ0_9EUKA|nr:Myb-like DNA-binding domain-containing protein [Hexamita inflata]CAI9955995.1 Myb-like DNA-binding domain-containing protein [Hexamita inflata]CAI9958077.1 Myb-like DNA-binding domain-containing protein [Hexamita inflata]CAI9970323.1 Myb-like DNA-binding domain-containing protein [Hexamita inflata]